MITEAQIKSSFESSPENFFFLRFQTAKILPWAKRLVRVFPIQCPHSNCPRARTHTHTINLRSEEDTTVSEVAHGSLSMQSVEEDCRLTVLKSHVQNTDLMWHVCIPPSLLEKKGTLTRGGTLTRRETLTRKETLTRGRTLTRGETLTRKEMMESWGTLIRSGMLTSKFRNQARKYHVHCLHIFPLQSNKKNWERDRWHNIILQTDTDLRRRGIVHIPRNRIEQTDASHSHLYRLDQHNHDLVNSMTRSMQQDTRWSIHYWHSRILLTNTIECSRKIQQCINEITGEVWMYYFDDPASSQQPSNYIGISQSLEWKKWSSEQHKSS